LTKTKYAKLKLITFEKPSDVNIQFVNNIRRHKHL